MSCQSCSGCFTGKSCHTTRNSNNVQDDEHFRALLQHALTSNVDLNQETNHDHTIPTIVSILADNVYASQMALSSAYRQLQVTEFAKLAQSLYDHRITGSLVAWAWEYCQGDPNLLLTRMHSNTREELWDHLDGQAEVHEVFNGQSVGRVKR
ncbi:hypothetical protein BJV82DRAFT_416182 [Fennellomyces sp. T-0311]|nr:hypothetical protein BJV82DRAFT_416182 [Fennellomyces sp. T-0311]